MSRYSPRYRRPGLGNVITIPPRSTVVTRAMLLDRNVAAAGLIFGGLFSAASLILFATGRDRAGYILGVTSALWGAALSAIRVFSSWPTSPPAV